MNSLYFFLFVVLTVSTFGIAEAYRGEDYSNTLNPDGTGNFVINLPKWIYNGEEYVPFIFTDGTNKKIETGHGSVILNANGTYSFFKKGTIDGRPLFTDRIVAKYADVSNLNSWTYLNSLNNDTPDISFDGNTVTSSKVNGVGQLDYKYILNNGKWKTQLEATNLSALTTNAFGFDQIIDLNSDTIKFGGIVRNLDNFNGKTFHKQFLQNNKGKVLDFLNGINFDFDLGFENLYSVTIYDIGIGKSRLVFDYRTSTPLLPNETLVIDPTFTSSTPSSEGRIYSNSITSTSCDTSLSTGDGILIVRKGPSGSSDNCQAIYFNFDTSSIGTNITSITSAALTYDVTTVYPSDNCDIKHLGFTGATNEATYDALTQDVGDVIDAVSNSATCTTVGNNKGEFFGSSVYSRIMDDVNTDGIVTIGMFFANVTRSTVEIRSDFSASDATLNFTYTFSPINKVSDLSNSTTPTSSTIGLNWTAPSVISGYQITGYQINVTTPQTDTPLVLINDTGSTTTNYNVTGLFFDTSYSARVSGWLNNTGHPYNNATGNVFNFTTTNNIFSGLAPTNFMMLPNGTSTSILNLNWTAPTMNNLNGYRILCEAPVGGGFSTTVSNTTTAGTSYNRTGLVVNTYYNCKVAGLNGSGITDYSNTYSQTTYHLPDAVDDLVATPTDIIDIVLTFTQPDTLYGYLTGYNINYTTPQSSDPLTVYVESTGSSDVSYTLTGLDTSEDYSFRASAITIHGKNVTGALVANATTFSEFEIGSLDLPTGTNPVQVPIQFVEYPLNSSASDLQVRYDSSYALSCDFAYMFGDSNQTYSGLTETTISGSSVYSNFTLLNLNNDIIDVYCWDTLDMDTDGRERLGSSNGTVPLFDQISSFQTGAFGTTGKFGALDLITLFIVIISMIGFNRDHPEVGVAIMGTMMGVCYFYGIIQWETGLTGAVILVVALAIANSKRGSSN